MGKYNYNKWDDIDFDIEDVIFTDCLICGKNGRNVVCQECLIMLQDPYIKKQMQKLYKAWQLKNRE